MTVPAIRKTKQPARKRAHLNIALHLATAIKAQALGISTIERGWEEQYFAATGIAPINFEL